MRGTRRWLFDLIDKATDGSFSYWLFSRRMDWLEGSYKEAFINQYPEVNRNKLHIAAIRIAGAEALIEWQLRGLRQLLADESSEPWQIEFAQAKNLEAKGTLATHWDELEHLVNEARGVEKVVETISHPTTQAKVQITLNPQAAAFLERAASALLMLDRRGVFTLGKATSSEAITVFANEVTQSDRIGSVANGEKVLIALEKIGCEVPEKGRKLALTMIATVVGNARAI